MKKFNYVLIGLFLLINQTVFSQLQITQQGNVGLGTNTPWERLHVANGSAIISNNGRSLRLWSWTTVAIGSNYGTISCWEKDSKWNQVNAKKFYKVSDGTLKTDIIPINNPTDILTQLNGVYFRYKNDSVILPTNTVAPTLDYDYGFIAQDVEQILPDIVYNTDFNIKAIDYNSITPILVEGFKQQQQIITQLQAQMDSISEALSACCNNSSQRLDNNTNSNNNSNNLGKLFQNQPNPFKESTTIRYILNNDDKASIMIFDMQGTLLKDITLFKNKESITINANELMPGMYLYSLIINNQEIDTKKMIITD